jgi:hypothetical protein
MRYGPKIRASTSVSAWISKYPNFDPDAAAYISAVQQADQQTLEMPVKEAFNTFVLKLKSDSLWNSINAAVILAGARTLTGALVPLKGSAPTSYNFVSGDYNRKTGLIGDGSTTYIDTNIAHNVQTLNNAHISLFVSQLPTAGTRTLLRSASGCVTAIGQDTNPDPNTWFIHDTGSSVPRFTDSGTGFKAVARSNSSNFIRRSIASIATIARTASATSPGAGTFNVFQSSTGTAYADARIAFYSIGANLNLALLDFHVTSLYNAISDAI